MHIVIDARLAGQTGVGRYIRNLVAGLISLDRENRYTLIVRPEDRGGFLIPPSFGIYETGLPWHSVAEQFYLPAIYHRLKPDLVHVPYLNYPVFYGGRTVVTIHDLTHLTRRTGRASTRPAIWYGLKNLALRLVVLRAVYASARILTVSQSVAGEIAARYPAAAGKITVTYEGVDSGLTREIASSRRPVLAPYLLYVGNAYPHKNLNTLVAAFRNADRPGLKLVLAGPDDFFYRRLRESCKNDQRILFVNPKTDPDLAGLYQNAQAAVFPSFSEGFGLPPLEALSFGTRVFCSDIPVFREILGGEASYFDPYDPDTLTALLTRLGKLPKRRPPEAFFRRFSWAGLAEKTLSVYRQAAGISL